MQDMTPFEPCMLVGLEFDIKIKQRSVCERDEYILVEGNDACIDNGKTHLNGDQE